MATVRGLAQRPQLTHVLLNIGLISGRKLHLLPVILPSVLLIGDIIKYGPNPSGFATYSNVAIGSNLVSHHGCFTLV